MGICFELAGMFMLEVTAEVWGQFVIIMLCMWQVLDITNTFFYENHPVVLYLFIIQENSHKTQPVT
jgi:hypothetical protein